MQMLLVCFTKHENIINVDHHKFIKKGAENIVHGGLESSRRVGKAKTQNFELVMPKRCPESSFWDILLRNPDLVIPRLQIQARKHLGTRQRVE